MLKVNVYLFVVFMCFFYVETIFSQELDKNFLESLPDDVREDVIKRSEESDSNEEAVYRSSKASSEIKKNEDLLLLKQRLEEDLLYLENLLNEEENSNQINLLPLFGEDFFDTAQTSFMPINEPNLDSSYILDFGDVLEIQIIGQISSNDTYIISRDGSIKLDDVGKLNLLGLPLGEAISLIKSKVNSVLIGTDVYVSLVGIRDINILVSGDAFNPGVYTLNGNSNMLHALSMAGGVNEFGSLRKINLIRNGKIIDSLDLYDVLITGTYNSKTRLRTGDTIFITPVKNIISIDGAVKRPARYEVLDDQNLETILEYANGLSVDADLKNISLNRILDGRFKSLPISNISQFTNIVANDGDQIFIRKFPFRTVEIRGAVLKPGFYSMSEGDSIEELIELSGGYTKNAYPFGAVYENQEALIVNKMAKKVLYEEFLDNIIIFSQRNVSGSVDLDSIISLSAQLKTSESNGRIVINPINSTLQEEILIKDKDKVVVPERNSHIYIYGEVSSEGGVLFNSNNNDVSHYVEKSGGFKSTANKEAIYILYPNGETQKYSIKRNLFANKPNSSIELYPGSVIFVPREIDDSAIRRLSAQAYVSILGNIGVALASLSAIDNN